MDVYRIHPAVHPALDGVGARLTGGRWNPRGIRMVYASLAYEGALLEQLAHVPAGDLPAGQRASRIVIPDDCVVPAVGEAEHPDWRSGARSQRIGAAWVESARSVALKVPSFVAQPWGWNVILNPLHPDFARVSVAEAVDVVWDARFR
ncbi:MAG: RES domain-containing protein [Gammaproteobacteria bacterium]|nr:RES domain-containing protein [Gammaproteobacteria bacterium]MDE0259632.1 RES domain-containing protein [Gammaproteobacteria bacterium]